jgi:signal transduction histidine kinase
VNTLSPNFYQSLLKAMPGRICVLGPQLEVIAFNDGFISFMKHYYHVNIKRNKPFYEIIPKDRSPWIGMVQDAYNGKSYREVVMFRNAQKVFYARVDIKALSDEGQSEGVLIEVNDVTKEKSNELYLSAFRKLAGNLPATDVFLCDEKMNVLIAGGGEMKKYDAGPEQFEGRNMLDLAIEYNIEQLIPCYEKGMRGEASQVEYEYGQGYYGVEIHPVIENNKVMNIIVLSKNITDHKSITLRLQQLNQTKDNILGIVAHDLRSPVSAILSILDLAKESNGVLLGDSSAMIELSCNMALSTINDLLDISELGKEDYVLETETTYLNEYLLELVHNNKMLAESKHITIEFETEESDLFVSLNPDKFARVFNNLLTNAIKFSHPKQKVMVSTSRKKKKVLIRIKDEGIGIPREMQGYIFDKFTRAGRRGTAGEKSIGLGMSIVKQIVLLHKGNIWVESEEDVGTTVCIELESAI